MNNHTHHALIQRVMIRLLRAARPVRCQLLSALVRFHATFGVFNVIQSDPGSDLMSKIVEQLNLLLGIQHRVSLVDVHTSSGAEGGNKKLLLSLREFASEFLNKKQWGSNVNMALITLQCDSTINSETGYTPFELHFGTHQASYGMLNPRGTRLLDDAQSVIEHWDKYVLNLNADLLARRSLASLK